MDAITLLSGGLDSALVLALLGEKKKRTLALSFDYGQRHIAELDAAKKLTAHYDAEHHIIKIDPQIFSLSSLVSFGEIPRNRSLKEMEEGGIPSTYVPARNTIFLSYALAFAEMTKASEIHFGPNAHDKFGYPDCTEDYTSAFQHLINTASRHAPKLITPLIHMTKADIIRKASELALPIDLTLSCYDPTPEGRHCRACDACLLRFGSSPLP